MSIWIDFSMSGITYTIPGPTVLLYLPNRKIIKRLYSVAVLNPDKSHIPTKNSTTPTTMPIMSNIVEIFVPPFKFINY